MSLSSILFHSFSYLLIAIPAAQIPEHVDEQVVVDGNTITSQGPATAMIFALKARVLLRGWD